MGLVGARCLFMNQSVWPKGGINALIGQAGSGACSWGSRQLSKGNSGALFRNERNGGRTTKTTAVPEGEGSNLGNESRKQECIYFPSQKGVRARDLDPSRKNLHNFRSVVTILIFSSSTLVSCCGWKDNQEGGRAGGTQSQFVGRPGERRFPQENEGRQLKKPKFLRGKDLRPEAERPGWFPGFTLVNSVLRCINQAFSTSALLTRGAGSSFVLRAISGIGGCLPTGCQLHPALPSCDNQKCP